MKFASEFRRGRRRGVVATALLLTLAAAAMPARAQDDELTGLLEDVGREYAKAYVSPILYSFGPNLNSGLYSTAAIPQARLTINVGLKFMATHLNEADQSFRRVIENVDLGAYDPAFAGQTGTVVMSGPTVFGDTETLGTVEGYVSGVQVFSQEAIEGLVDTRFSPLFAPEASVGGIAGFRATLRYLPEMKLSDAGKVKFVGYGLQWSANGVVPTLPVDVMVGFFKQSLDLGESLSADASSIFLGVSKSLPALTVYGGFAKESSDLSVSYTYTGTGQTIAFDVDGTQESRVTLGATIDLLGRLNVEVGHGDVTTYAAGLMYGF